MFGFRRTAAAKECPRKDRPGAPAGPGLGGSGLLLAVGSGAILLSLVLPVYPFVIDVALLFLLFFACAAAVLPAARDPGEAASIGVLLVLITLLRIGVSLYVMKAIMLQERVGLLVTWSAAVVHSPAGAVAAGIIVCAACCIGIGILRAAQRKFISVIITTLPQKQAQLVRDLHGGSESKEYEKKRAELERQSRFYIGAASGSKLLVFDYLLAMVVATTGITLSIFSAKVAIPTTTMAIMPQQAGAINLLTAIPIVLVPAGMKMLAKRQWPSMEANAATGAEETETAIRRVESREITPEPSEPVKDETPDPAIEAVDLAANTVTHADEEIEGFDEMEPENESGGQEFDYEIMTKMVSSHGPGAVLLIGRTADELPVTVPVNMGIRLAQQDKRCLIMDLDAARNAAAEAFELPADLPGKALLTCIHGLWVCSAEETVSVAKKLKRALRIFDYVLIYAPHDPQPGVFEQAGIKTAVVFGESEPQAIRNLIKEGCTIIPERLEEHAKINRSHFEKKILASGIL
jgi:hypothetical protein